MNKGYGRFSARIVERGYTQIPGVYFTKNYSPVVSEVTLCIILLMWLINKCYYYTIDVKTEFLYAAIEGEIYTNITEVMTEVLGE